MIRNIYILLLLSLSYSVGYAQSGCTDCSENMSCMYYDGCVPTCEFPSGYEDCEDMDFVGFGCWCNYGYVFDDNGNCIALEDCEEIIYGCTDPSACNYDETATEDDGSCIYPEENYDCDGNCIVEIDCAGICGGYFEIISAGGNCSCCGNPYIDCMPPACACEGEIDGSDCNENIDSDGDGVIDSEDSDPNNPYQCSDIDADSCDDCVLGYYNTEYDVIFEYDQQIFCNFPDSGFPLDEFSEICWTTVDFDCFCSLVDCCCCGDCDCGCEYWHLDDIESYSEDDCVGACSEAYDCAGTWGGSAVIDECGVCAGDNTGCAGCTDPEACNYDPEAIIDDGSCEEEICDDIVCLDQGNYWCDDEGNIYDYCVEIFCNPCAPEAEPCLSAGCTDPSACNYDETATIDDGSCLVAECPNIPCDWIEYWCDDEGNIYDYCVEIFCNPCAPEAEPCPDCLYGSGDVNCDGVLNVIDLLQIVYYILDPNNSPFDPQQFGIADSNYDGIVDILDVVNFIDVILNDY